MEEDTLQSIAASAPNLLTTLSLSPAYNDEELISIHMLEFWQKHLTKHYLPLMELKELSVRYDPAVFDQLIAPVRKYMANSDDPDKVFAAIKKVVPGPVVCGKVFKTGQPIYSCIDCALDNTCVLCVECFKHSEHRFHDYRMTHGSSGCCDCGDAEAWTNAPNCSIHMRDMSKDDFREDLSKIFAPGDSFDLFLKRMKTALAFLLNYCYEMLSWQTPALPKVLGENPKDPEELCYATALYNDETHTYDHVVLALTKSIACDPHRATEIANVVDQEGRCLIFKGTKAECSRVQQEIATRTIRTTEKELISIVFHIDVIAHQNFAYQIINWVRDLISVCEEYRVAYAGHMYKQSHSTHWLGSETSTKFPQKSLVEKVVLSDVAFWKDIRTAWQKQMMHGLLIDMEMKKKFAKIFVRNFKEIMEDFMNDDHEQRWSIVSLSVQIFTVPSISLMLIEEENVIEIILTTFLDLTRGHHSYERFRFGRSQRELAQFRRIIMCFDSLTYVLDRSMETNIWTERMRRHFNRGFEKLLENLKLMQSIDSVVRQIERHIEFEPSLEHGIHLQMSLSPIMRSMSLWAATDAYVYDVCFRVLLKKFQDYFRAENTTKLAISAGGETCDCFIYDVSTKEVSFHIPLVRLISHFCMYSTDLPFQFDLCKTLDDISMGFDSLLEFPLRVQVLISQYRSGMWRRNGTNLGNHLMYMQVSHHLRESTIDADYILMQICAAYMNPNHFLIILLNKYSLNFLVNELNRDPKEDEEIHQLNLMIEEFFKLVYILLVERYVKYIGDVTPEDIVKYETIQWLCVSPMSNSKLKSNLNLPKGVNVDAQILEVANFKKPQNSTKHGEYQLKDSYRRRFNPFFHRFTRQDQESAHVEQQKKQRANNEKYVCCPPPEVPNFVSKLARIPNLLICDVMFGVLKKILIKTCDLTDNLFSDSHFQHVLYILGLGLREQEKNLKGFQFVEKCTEWGFLAMLEQCNGRHILPRIEAHQHLLGWTFDKFKEIQQKLKPVESSHSEAMEGVEEGGSNSTQKDEELKALKKKKALEHRQAIVARMKAAQSSFLKDNEEFLKLNSPSGLKSSMSSSISMNDLSESSGSSTTTGNNEIALGVHQDIASRQESASAFDRLDFTCILCLETHPIQSSDGLMIAVGFCQKSTVISLNREVSKPNPVPNVFIDSDLKNVTYANSCGHWFHYRCFQKHLDQQKIRDRSRTLNRPKRNYDEKKGEFICPMCKTICNFMIPIMCPTKINPRLIAVMGPNDFKYNDYPMLDWLSDMHYLASDNLIELEFSLTPVQEIGFCTQLDDKIQSRPLLKITQQEYFSQKQINFLKNTPTDDLCTIVEVVHKCLSAVYENSIYENPDATDEYDPSPTDLDKLNSLYHAIANDIQVFERCQRQNILSWKKVKDSIQFIGVRALVELVKSHPQYYSNIWAKRQYVYSMKYLLEGTFYQALNRSVLDTDAFGLFVSLLLTVPSVFGGPADNHHYEPFVTPLGNAVEHNCFLLMFTFHLVQIVLTNTNICDPEEAADDTMDVEEKPETGSAPPDQNLTQICMDILTAAGHQFDRESFTKNPTLVSDRIREKMLPFLRCSAMFAHFYTGVSFPKRLLDGSVVKLLYSHHALVGDEFEALCNYLGISTGLCFLGISNLKNVALSWAKHPNIRAYFELKTEDGRKPRSVLLHEYRFLQQCHPVRRLVPLPSDYSDLVNRSADFKCPTTGQEARYPTMCLVCGEILCSQNFCCQEKHQKDMFGACMKHILKCGKGSGVFLRLKDCKVMLLNVPTRGRFLPAPYLDKYGETDQGLKRGSPLYLSNETYEKLNEMWMRHQIPEQIVQYLECYSGLTAISWNVM